MTSFSQYFILVCVSDWQCCMRYENCDPNRQKTNDKKWDQYLCGLKSDWSWLVGFPSDVQYNEKYGLVYYFLFNDKWNLKISFFSD